MTKNEAATVRWIAKELESLELFNDVNLRLSKWEGAGSLRQQFEVQYAKLRRMGNELKRLANGENNT